MSNNDTARPRIAIYDPPLCCSTGVCGPDVDPELVRLAQDVKALEEAGVPVDRFNLAQQPIAFAENEIVRDLLEKEGNDCLPVILVNDALVLKGLYPTREQLFKLAGKTESADCCDDSSDCCGEDASDCCSEDSSEGCCDDAASDCCGDDSSDCCESESKQSCC